MATEGETVTEQQPAAEEPEKVVTEKKTKPKATKEKKPKQSKTLAHPPYFQMITEALMGLQDKSGSSPYAIAKYMEDKHKDELPPNFRKILAVQLKHFAAKGKLIKVRASYKLSEVGKKEKPTETKTKAPRSTTVKKTRSVTAAAKIKAEVAAAVAVPKKAKRSTAAKPKQPKSIKSSAAKKAKKATAA